ncbi:MULTISPECIES: hypothetical protein [Anaeromyxobacter]|uniref:hypothetical protein n=1 Tax=Anaeromyxobacter TaxID=161492 RepID=UPI001F567E64|nr:MULTISPECIES: hypothetical protein [unclassified Anaeromyxobacter]
MSGPEQPNACRDDEPGDASPIDRILTGPGQLLLAVTLVGAAVAAALWFRATALDPETADMSRAIWAFPRIGVTLGFFIASAATLERIGVPIYRTGREDGEDRGEPWRVWLGVLGMSGALFLLASLLLGWDG